MCLDAVTKRHRPPLREVIAWKVLDVIEGGLTPPYYGDGPLALGVWLRAKRSNSGGGYISGFHAFTSRSHARGFAATWGGVIRRVRLRGVRVEGIQSDRRCYVADEMYVPKKAR